MTIEQFDFGDGVPPGQTHSAYRTERNRTDGHRTNGHRTVGNDLSFHTPDSTRLMPEPHLTYYASFDQPRPFDLTHYEPISGRHPSSNDSKTSQSEQPSQAASDPKHTSAAGKPRMALRGFSLVVALAGHAVVGTLIAAGGNLALGAVTSVAVMSCSAALVATEALANQ